MEFIYVDTHTTQQLEMRPEFNYTITLLTIYRQYNYLVDRPPTAKPRKVLYIP